MDDSSFNMLLIEIIDNVFEKKTRKHIQYYDIIQKLWNSNRYNKLLLSKYLLGRLIRESERIFLKAQNMAERHCPSCSAKDPEIPKGTVFH
ncbi:MAG: hypothetical protein ACJ0GH_01780 [Alphaproteobacteria bacterium]|tara:strand:+ start:207 stop:479 length:273 start_codon:yes stop_codon:yes gene_type:complete